MTECPACGEEMVTRGASGTQTNSIGAPVDVDISWDQCPDCGYVIDDMGNEIPP